MSHPSSIPGLIDPVGTFPTSPDRVVGIISPVTEYAELFPSASHKISSQPGNKHTGVNVVRASSTPGCVGGLV